jgi:hypothetical protein
MEQATFACFRLFDVPGLFPMIRSWCGITVIPPCDAIPVQQGQERVAEAQEVFTRPHYQDRRSDDPEQYRAIRWLQDRLFTVIFEIREDNLGEYCHLVTLWRSTREERELYEANS